MSRDEGPLILCFGLIDEIDVIRDFLEYHLSIGIDRFIATDVGSTDGTLDVLAEYERLGLLDLTRLNDPTIREEKRDWWTPMAARARDRYRASWGLFCDPDEFWVFPDSSPRTYFASLPAAIAILPRYNVVPSRQPGTGRIADFRTFDLIVRRPLSFFYDIGRLKEPGGAEAVLAMHPPDIIRVVAPKVAARPEIIRTVVPGPHDVVATDPSVKRHHEAKAYIAHIPVRSRRQFASKAELVSRYIAVNPPEVDRFSSRHWVRLAAIFDAGLIDREFERQILSDDEVAARLKEGVLERDPRLPAGFAKQRAMA